MQLITGQSNYKPSIMDEQEMSCVYLSTIAADLAQKVRSNPEMYRSEARAELLEASFQVCRALDAIEMAKAY